MIGWKDRKVVNPTGEVFFLIFSKARDVGCWGSAWGNSSNPVPYLWSLNTWWPSGSQGPGLGRIPATGEVEKYNSCLQNCWFVVMCAAFLHSSLEKRMEKDKRTMYRLCLLELTFPSFGGFYSVLRWLFIACHCFVPLTLVGHHVLRRGRAFDLVGAGGMSGRRWNNWSTRQGCLEMEVPQVEHIEICRLNIIINIQGIDLGLNISSREFKIPCPMDIVGFPCRARPRFETWDLEDVPEVLRVSTWLRLLVAGFQWDVLMGFFLWVLDDGLSGILISLMGCDELWDFHGV